MRPPRVGLVLENGHVTVAAIRGRGKAEHFRLEVDETLAARLTAELKARGLSTRRVRVGLDRSLLIVKVLELPRAAGGNLRQMIGFDLERHVPFPPEEIRFDCCPLPTKPERPLRVLVVACEGRTVDGVLRLLDAIKRRPFSLTCAAHQLRGLLPRRLSAARAVWAHRHGPSTDLLFLGRGGIRLSRNLPITDGSELAREIERSLPLVQWRECPAIWISGDESERFLSALELAALGAPVSAPPYKPVIAALLGSFATEQQGAGLLALGVAAGHRHPILNLLPQEMRPKAPSRTQWVTAATTAVTALLGMTLLYTQVLTEDRYLARLSQEIRRLEPEVKAVERLAAEATQQKRLLATLQSLQDGGIRPLPVLRELTQLVPADAWLQGLAMDRQGLELTGQATDASQLIPILEGSASLERVEFTSSVNKAQGTEQFRLRASWEGPAPAPQATPLRREGRVRGSP